VIRHDYYQYYQELKFYRYNDLILLVSVVVFYGFSFGNESHDGSSKDGAVFVWFIFIVNLVRLVMILVYQAYLFKEKNQYKISEYNQQLALVSISNPAQINSKTLAP